MNPKEIIAIDARMIEASGIGTYIRNLMGQGIYGVALGDEAVIRKYDQDVAVIPFMDKIYGLKEQFHFPYKALEAYGVTKLHCPHYNIPLLYNKKMVVTVHDLIHLRFLEYLPNKAAYFYAWFMLKMVGRKAEKILTVSEYSKQDMLELLHTKQEKIAVIYNALEEGYYVKQQDEYAYLYDKYGIGREEKVLLYVGNLKPHKNLERLTRAFANLTISNVKLLLVGKDFGNSSIQEEILKNNLNEKVVFAGMVSHEELVDLYNFADIFVFPSLYEGFGFPPLEAMACGTLVVCSNAASLPEVVGNAAIMFDPKNEQEMTEQIRKGLSLSEDERQRMIESGFGRVVKFGKQEFVENTRKWIEMS